MKDVNKVWHTSTLQAYNNIMFESLIYAHNITTESEKVCVFENDKTGEEVYLKGYFAMKDVDGEKKKYFITSGHYGSLPIRVNESEELYYKESARSKSVVHLPVDITPFRIRPQQCWESTRQFVDEIAPFSHTHPAHWTINKIVAIMGYVGKTFCGVSSSPEFGKSSIYLILDAITKKIPVFQPRSVPGVMAQITGNGNMVFDDIHAVPSDVMKIMENFSFDVASNKAVYTNGALRSKNTKTRYDVSQQSITYLYNRFTDYNNPEKQFWDNLWGNVKAMQSRFLRLKFTGKLTEQFDKEFDVKGIAEENKLFYINVAKHLLWLKEIKLSNSYKRKYPCKNSCNLKGRHKSVYDEITWLVDMYSESLAQYETLKQLLDQCIADYITMYEGTHPVFSFAPEEKVQTEVVEEFIQEEKKSDSQIAKDYLLKRKEAAIESFLLDTGISEASLKTMLSDGTLYEPRAGYVREL